MATSTYLIALGSNRPGRHGRPAREVAAALAVLEGVGAVVAASRIVATPPLGPSIRRFANACALIDSALPPPAMLARLKAIERAFGRRAGRRWGARVIDLDIVLWSGGAWRSRTLIIPHPRYAERGFVLDPAVAVAPDWRDPVSGRSVRQIRARRAAPRPRSP